MRLWGFGVKPLSPLLRQRVQEIYRNSSHGGWRQDGGLTTSGEGFQERGRQQWPENVQQPIDGHKPVRRPRSGHGRWRRCRDHTRPRTDQNWPPTDTADTLDRRALQKFINLPTPTRQRWILRSYCVSRRRAVIPVHGGFQRSAFDLRNSNRAPPSVRWHALLSWVWPPIDHCFSRGLWTSVS